MKPRLSKQKNQALTLIEVLVILFVLTMIAATLLPNLLVGKHYEQRIACVNNLKEIGLAARLWSGDNNGNYPMVVSVTNGGAMELVATGNILAVFLTMTNELGTSRFLTCPADREHPLALQFDSTFSASNISYFVGVNANQSLRNSIFSGDDHLQFGGIPVKSGLSTFTTNSDLSWTSARHMVRGEHFWMPNLNHGNIGLADGSAQQLTSVGLQKALQQTGTNFIRLAIP